MDRLKDITTFVVVANLENRALNAGINKTRDWWKSRHSHDEKACNNQPSTIPESIPRSIDTGSSQLAVTVVRAQDLHESKLSIIPGSSSQRPFVTIECNQQRYQTSPADFNSSNRNPQWSSGNGPFHFVIADPNIHCLTVWIQQHDPFHIGNRNEAKVVGFGEIHVRQLINHDQMWLPLRRHEKPAGTILFHILFSSKDKIDSSFTKIL